MFSIASLNLFLIIYGFSFVSSLLYMSKRQVLSATAEMENFLGPANFPKYRRNCFQRITHQCMSWSGLTPPSPPSTLWDSRLQCHVELAVCQHEPLKVPAFVEDTTSFLLCWTAHLALKLWSFLWRRVEVLAVHRWHLPFVIVSVFIRTLKNSDVGNPDTWSVLTRINHV